MLQDFLEFSSEVTGFSKFRLQGTGQAQLYLDTVSHVVGPSLVAELLQVFMRVRSEAKGDATALDTMLRRDIFSDEKLGPIARNIVKLWFVGTWYQLPTDWSEAFGVREQDTTFVASPIAYTEGLLWPTIDANPSGAKGPGWGTWAAPPRIPEM